MPRERCPIADAPADGSRMPSASVLSDRARGLSRADAMKDVVGPYLDELLRPLYAVGLSDEEEAYLTVRAPATEFLHLGRFSDQVRGIIDDRAYENSSVQAHLAQFLRFANSRKDLFYYADNGAENIISEGVSGGVIVPLTVASQIYRIEKEFRDSQSPRYGSSDLFDFDAGDIVEIMERLYFDKILLQLTKGPNGFLGDKSTKLGLRDAAFFDFHYQSSPGDSLNLKIEDAYEVQDGKVVGLSGAYHMAAQLKRSRLRDDYRQYDDNPLAYHPTDSSGCPVRHSFEGASSGGQEPLIVTARKFMTAALVAVREYSSQISETVPVEV